MPPNDTITVFDPRGHARVIAQQAAPRPTATSTASVRACWRTARPTPDSSSNRWSTTCARPRTSARPPQAASP